MQGQHQYSNIPQHNAWIYDSHFTPSSINTHGQFAHHQRDLQYSQEPIQTPHSFVSGPPSCFDDLSSRTLNLPKPAMAAGQFLPTSSFRNGDPANFGTNNGSQPFSGTGLSGSFNGCRDMGSQILPSEFENFRADSKISLNSESYHHGGDSKTGFHGCSNLTVNGEHLWRNNANASTASLAQFGDQFLSLDQSSSCSPSLSLNSPSQCILQTMPPAPSTDPQAIFKTVQGVHASSVLSSPALYSTFDRHIHNVAENQVARTVWKFLRDLCDQVKVFFYTSFSHILNFFDKFSMCPGFAAARRGTGETNAGEMSCSTSGGQTQEGQGQFCAHTRPSRESLSCIVWGGGS
jgi:hypothetical protein